jgi:hypothetical protein
MNPGAMSVSRDRPFQLTGVLGPITGTSKVAAQSRNVGEVERRVRAWKRQHGAEGALFLIQEHHLGDRLQPGWCHAMELGVQIGTQRLEHHTREAVA